MTDKADAGKPVGPTPASTPAPVPAILGPPPAFVEDHPNVWIIQLDLYFARAQIISEAVRFQTAASLLPAHHVMEFIDMIRSPPVDCYTQLCTALQTRLGKSSEEKLRSLLEAQELGDRKPSQFLRHLQELTTPYMKDEESPLIRQIFLKAMPEAAAPFLQFLPPDTKLATLAGTADRVIASLPRANSVVGAVCGVSSTNDHRSCPQAQANSLKLDELSQQLREISLQLRTLGRQRSRSRSSTPSRRRDVSNVSGVCWYHRSFGKRARTCTKPCTYDDSLNC